jgi:hypothetical protein
MRCGPCFAHAGEDVGSSRCSIVLGDVRLEELQRQERHVIGERRLWHELVHDMIHQCLRMQVGSGFHRSQKVI